MCSSGFTCTEHYKYVSEAVQLVSRRSWYEAQIFCLNLHLYATHFVLAMSLPEYWFRQGLCPLSIALICQVRLGREVVFTRLMDLFGLLPLSCLFEWGMPLKVTSLPSQMLKGEKYVWENANMLWNILFSSPPHPTTSYHVLFPSSGQIYLAGFQQSLPALLKMPQGAKNIILKTSLLARVGIAASAGVHISFW